MNFDEFKNIPGYHKWKNMIRLNKGWSIDEKYIVTDVDGNQYLLRITDSSHYKEREKQFNLLLKVAKVDVNASYPFSFGKLNEEKIYTLLSWIDGEDAEEGVAKLSDEEAYILGRSAGDSLRKLHSIDVDIENEPKWIDKYRLKIERKYKALNECEIEIKDKELFIKYMNDHLYLLENRPQTFTHGDYHVGNMLISNGQIAIIDFEKNKISDPYDEFKQFIWNVRANEYFETGMINAYFDDKIPSDFFPILKVYAVEQLISFIPWCCQYGYDDIKKGLEIMNYIMDSYDNLNKDIPSWYKGILKV